MSHRWLFCLFPLLLSACFTSERPVIKSSDLALPSDLAGAYWSVSGSDGVDISGTSFRRTGAGYSVKATGDDKSSSLRLVQAAAPDLFLLIDDSEGDNSSTYYLLHRATGGVWQIVDVDVDDESPFSRANFAFLNRAASPYGFSLAEGGEATPIIGSVKTGRIPELFRDRNFLGGLRIKGMITYLPTRGHRPTEVNVTNEATASSEIRLDHGLKAPVALSDPPGFEGAFVDRNDQYFSSWSVVDMTRLPDGRYMHGTFEKLSLLRIPGEEELYLAVCERDYGKPDSPSYTYSLLLVDREDDGWRIRPISVGVQRSLPELDAMREENMRSAARRLNMVFSEGTLSGDITAEHLLALIGDGQFTGGLRTDLLPEVHLRSDVGIARLFREHAKRGAKPASP